MLQCDAEAVMMYRGVCDGRMNLEVDGDCITSGATSTDAPVDGVALVGSEMVGFVSDETYVYHRSCKCYDIAWGG